MFSFFWHSDDKRPFHSRFQNWCPFLKTKGVPLVMAALLTSLPTSGTELDEADSKTISPRSRFKAYQNNENPSAPDELLMASFLSSLSEGRHDSDMLFQRFEHKFWEDKHNQNAFGVPKEKIYKECKPLLEDLRALVKNELSSHQGDLFLKFLSKYYREAKTELGLLEASPSFQKDLALTYFECWTQRPGDRLIHIGPTKLEKTTKNRLKTYMKTADTPDTEVAEALVVLYCPSLLTRKLEDSPSLVKLFEKMAVVSTRAQVVMGDFTISRNAGGRRNWASLERDFLAYDAEKPYKDTKANYEKAKDYYLRSGDNADPRAFLEMGHLYMNGLGVKKDFKKAYDFYSKTYQDKSLWKIKEGPQNEETLLNDSWYTWDKQNIAKSALCLGVMHYRGLGVKKDEEKAKDFFFSVTPFINAAGSEGQTCAYYAGLCGKPEGFEVAAKAGHLKSQMYLAEGYIYGGKGVKKDFVKARFWVGQALESAKWTSREREVKNLLMTLDELEKI